MHQGQGAPLRRCVYLHTYTYIQIFIYMYVYTHTHTHMHHSGRSAIRTELTTFTFPWKTLLQRQALRISHPNGSRSPSARNESCKGRKMERSLQEREGGVKGTPAPPRHHPRAVSYLCTCSRAHNNELCHIPFSLHGISSPFLWDLSGEII